MRLEKSGEVDGVDRRVLSDADGVQLVREIDLRDFSRWWSVRTQTSITNRVTHEGAELVAATMREWARARRVAAIERGDL
jgi:hypothetical protein